MGEDDVESGLARQVHQIEVKCLDRQGPSFGKTATQLKRCRATIEHGNVHGLAGGGSCDERQEAGIRRTRDHDPPTSCGDRLGERRLDERLAVVGAARRAAKAEDRAKASDRCGMTRTSDPKQRTHRPRAAECPR